MKIRHGINKEGVGINIMDSADGKPPWTREEKITASFDLLINLIIGLSMLGGIIGFFFTMNNPTRVWGIYSVCWAGLISAVVVDRKYGR